jgi:hypothetical protein
MAGIPLFIAEPTGTCRLRLRRFRHGGEGESHFHDAAAVIDENAPSSRARLEGRHRAGDDRVPRGDPRWPAACPCGCLFEDDDEWQVNELPWYEGSGHRFAWGIGSWDGPAGAMIRAPWRDDTPDNGCPAWTVFLPNGTTWCTRDQASVPGGGRGSQWTITGVVPHITVHPSINDQGTRPWHGWIRNGELVEA